MVVVETKDIQTQGWPRQTQRQISFESRLRSAEHNEIFFPGWLGLECPPASFSSFSMKISIPHIFINNFSKLLWTASLLSGTMAYTWDKEKDK